MFLAVGIMPALSVGVLTWMATAKLSDAVGAQLRATSEVLGEKVDRNLFERYGDVQAFAVNSVLEDKNAWYKPDGAIVDAMNSYSSLYGFYDLLVLVDTSGKVVAVNNKSPTGKPIDTAFIYGQNFADTSWFKDAMGGKFLSSQTLTGTVVEDAYQDALIAKVYGPERLTLGFSAPVRDKSGAVVGVWKNFADFSLVKDMVNGTVKSMVDQGMNDAGITLVNAASRPLITKTGEQAAAVAVREPAPAGSVMALAAAGQHGWQAEGAGEQKRLSGFVRSTGALGYPGLGWSIISSVPYTQAQAQATMIRQRVMIVTTVCTGAVGLVGWLFARSQIKPITALRDRVQEIADGDGDLTRRVEVNSSDELGELGRNFNRFADKIHKTMVNVSAATREVAAAATEIAASAEEMAAGLQRQEQQTTRVSAAVEEMSASVQEVAHKGQAARAAADESQGDAVQGGQVVDQTVTEIKAIADEVTRSAAAVASLGQKSEQIGQIIEVINDIAEQTNLLALNAAIEAARAGEHGRGFAVVADEVRKLAERTTKATEEVAGSIKEIQADTRTAVQQIESGSARVAKGVDLANSAGNALGRITHSSQGLSGMVQSIAAAAEQQSATSAEIARSVEEINAVTRESAQGADQAAKAATMLSQQGERLQALVSVFRL